MTTEPVVARPAVARAIEFCLVSECLTEEKDQDRAALVRHDGGWIAVLCDGTTQSMDSAEAAMIATLDPLALWTENGVANVVTALNARRTKLICEAQDEELDPASFLDSAMARFMREARQTSFQTTFVTARVTPADAGGFVVEAKTVGDSALLVFDSNGQLLLSSPQIPDRDSAFGHRSSITEVLPDHFVSDDITVRKDVDSDSHIVLCSDGFYEAFATPGELFQWLVDHENDLRGEQRSEVIAELHGRLDKRTGDDDLSFIWLCPRTPPEVEALPAEVIENASPARAPARSCLYRIVVALICRLRALFPRSAPSVRGENAP